MALIPFPALTPPPQSAPSNPPSPLWVPRSLNLQQRQKLSGLVVRLGKLESPLIDLALGVGNAVLRSLGV